MDFELIFLCDLVSFQYESRRLEKDNQTIFRARPPQRPANDFVLKALLNGAFLFGDRN